MSANPFLHSDKFAGKRLHLGVTGSVACYKAAELLRKFLAMEMAVSVTLTAAAEKFVSPLLFESLGAQPVYKTMFADENIFAHLEPGDVADCMLVAPASANFLAKMANGLADDLLSCQYVAFQGPVLAAPAMNPRMWAHAATQKNIASLIACGVEIIEPGIGKMACGSEGQGRLAELEEIFLLVLRRLSPSDMAGKHVLVTLGPTREPWDGVRFWSNPSSGKMGSALATAAWLRGAAVTAICGPAEHVFLPAGVQRINVQTAAEMFAQAEQLWPNVDMAAFCAAVADFAPMPLSNNVKIHKSELPSEFTVNFSRNCDILATLANNSKGKRKILGFAAEMASSPDEMAACARKKLLAKNADLLACNSIDPASSSFGASQTAMAIVDKNDNAEFWPTRSKADLAWDLWSWLLKI